MGLIKTSILAGAGIYAVNKIAKTAEYRRDQQQPQQRSTSANAGSYTYRDHPAQDQYQYAYQYQHPDGPHPRGEEYYSATQPGQMHDPGEARGQSLSQSQGRVPISFEERRSNQYEKQPQPQPQPQAQARPLYLENRPYSPLPRGYNGASEDMYAPAQAYGPGKLDRDGERGRAPPPPPAYSGLGQKSGFVEAYDGSGAGAEGDWEQGQGESRPGGGRSAALLDTLAQHLMGGDEKKRRRG